MGSFDAIVIGAGPAGEVCAWKLAEGGMKVAIAERELVAGECSYWACMPSKAFVRPGEVLDQARRAPGAAQAVTGELDPAEVLNWRDIAASNRDDTGHAQWLADQTERIVIATGSDPVIPPIEGLRELDGVWTTAKRPRPPSCPASSLSYPTGRS